MQTNVYKLKFFRQPNGEIVFTNYTSQTPKEIEAVYVVVALLLRIFWLNLTDFTLKDIIRDKIIDWVSNKEIDGESYGFPANKKFTLIGGIGYFVKVKFPFMMTPPDITFATVDFVVYFYKKLSEPGKKFMIDLLYDFAADLNEHNSGASGLTMIKGRFDNSFKYNFNTNDYYGIRK